MRHPQHPHADEIRNRGTAGLALFAPDAEQERLVRVPDIRTDPPAAPGSRSSRAAALAVALQSPFRRASWRKIMLVLGSLSAPVSREDLCQRTGMKESSMCARLDELRPLWVEQVDQACVSNAGLRVDGYRLTAGGRARVLTATTEVVR